MARGSQKKEAAGRGGGGRGAGYGAGQGGGAGERQGRGRGRGRGEGGWWRCLMRRPLSNGCRQGRGSPSKQDLRAEFVHLQHQET